MGIASNIADVVRFNPSAGGLTDWTYSSAVTGYQGPAAAGMVAGSQYSFRAESSDLTQWEVTTGLWDGTKLVRSTVLFNSLGTTAKINFSAAPQVAVIALAEDLAQGRNRAINSRFNVDQLNLGAVVAVSSNGYGSDQWRGLVETGTVNVQSQRSDSGFPGGNGMVQALGVNVKFGLFQPIESVTMRDLIGQNATLSALLAVNNAATLSNVKMAIVQFTGTADAISGNPVSSWNAAGTNPTLATNWSYVTTPANLGVTATAARFSASGAVGGTAKNLGLLIWVDSKSAAINDALYVSDVQLEAGKTATPFDAKPYAVELLACQWFLRLTNQTTPKGNAAGSISMYAGGNNFLVGAVQWATLRVDPTGTFWLNGTQNRARNTFTGAVVTLTTINGANIKRNGFPIVQDTGGTPFTAGQFYDFDLILDARL